MAAPTDTQQYVVTRPFVADVGGVEIRLEAGEVIPGPRVPEIESWGRSVHFLVNTNRLAPVHVKVDVDASDAEIVDVRGTGLLEYFTDEELQAELASRGVEPEAEPESEPEAAADGDAENQTDDAPAGPTAEELLELKRADLNDAASAEGVADPEKLGNKQEVVDAIVAARAAAEATSEPEAAADGDAENQTPTNE